MTKIADVKKDICLFLIPLNKYRTFMQSINMIHKRKQEMIKKISTPGGRSIVCGNTLLGGPLLMSEWSAGLLTLVCVAST